jgi:UDP:flavonoid glycosyltransferase YjiC (YdhE family)
VGIPVYGDQKLNMLRTVSAGMGVMLEFENVTTDSLTWAITEVIENPRYLKSK